MEMMKHFAFKIALSTALLALTGCSHDDNSLGFLQSSQSGGGDCGIDAALPNSDETIHVSANTTSEKLFSITPTSSACKVSFTLNGTDLNQTTPSILMNGANLLPGTNKLVATVSGTSGSATKTWTIIKNSPPVCAAQVPSTSALNMSTGSSTSLTAQLSDADGDTLSYTWKVNGAAPALGVLVPTSGGTISQALLTATGLSGSNTVSVTANDGLDTTTCSWTVNIATSCSILSSSPSSSSLRVAASSTTPTSFTVNTSDPDCAVAWELNGVPLSNTSASHSLASTSLIGGANVLKASVSNGTSTTQKTWTILKNNPPTCASQAPGASGATAGAGNVKHFVAGGTDADSDALTYSWKLNGTPVGSEFVVSSNTADWTPTSAEVGTNTILATISDGYDTNTCSWNVSVQNPCTVSSSSPSGATVRALSPAASTTSFAVVPNDSSCGLQWKLNGTTLSETTSLLSLTSSQLNTGANTLVATLSNSVSTVTKTWTVTKNSAPTCSSQTPAATGNTLNAAGTLTLTANAADADSDALTFLWTNNGSAVPTANFTVSGSGTTSQAAFHPNSTFVGTNAVVSTISDGYESAKCSWNVSVLNDCSVVSSLPSATTTKVAGAGSTVTSFGVVPSDSSCAVSWTLNGNALSGTSSFQNITSSSLLPGTNTLVATLSNGASTVTRSWTVNKNQAPVCSAQTPTATGNQMDYSASKNFTANVTDADGDAVAFSWRLNGVVNASLFPTVNSTSSSSVATFQPTLGNVQNGQTVSASFNDGYDTGLCSWTLDIQDPNTVTISACTPSTASPTVVLSSGVGSTQTMTVSATGSGLQYQWYKDSSLLAGSTSPSLNLSAGTLAVGNYTVKSVVTDAYGNSANCTWTVKRNAAPAISNPMPTPSSTTRLNYLSTYAFSATASDANSDTLTYTWTLDGGASSLLPSGSASTTLSPNGDITALGGHTVKLTVSDGYESTSTSWPVEINLFSSECNTLFNSPVSSAGGFICTLAGNPSLGHLLYPAQDQTLIRFRPAAVLDDGSGNLFVTDELNHNVLFYNRSGSSITRLGKTIAAGQMQILVGNGANGLTPDGSQNNAFKLYAPQGLAWDSTNGLLYIADYSNHRVVVVDSTGAAKTIFGTLSTTQSAAANTDGIAGTSMVCGNPTGLKFVSYGGQKWLYIACYNTNAIRRMAADPTDAVNYGKGYTVVGRVSSAGSIAAGDTDGTTGPSGEAKADGPWQITDDGAGNIYWSDYSGYRIRMAAMGGSSVSLFTSRSASSTNFAFQAIDTSTTALTAASTASQALAAVGPVTKLSIYGPSNTQSGGCVPVSVLLYNSSNQAVLAAGSTTVSLSTTAGTFYSDSGCTSTTTGGTIATGAGSLHAYFKTTATATLTAASTGLTSASMAVSVVAGGSPTTLVAYVPANYNYLDCVRIMIQSESSTGQASLAGSTRVINLLTTNSGNFYTDSACSTTPINSVSLGASQTTTFVYYARTTIANSNGTTSLFGYTNNNAGSASGVGVGALSLRQPRGVKVLKSGTTIQGFFVSNMDHHRVNFVNNTTSTLTYGSQAIAGHQSGLVFGTGSGSFNGDSLFGSATTVNQNSQLDLDSTGSTLWVTDIYNYRVRALDLAANNGLVSTVLGAGKIRTTFVSDSPIPAPLATFNNPTNVVIDRTGRKMYVSDASNGRIRLIDMMTGYVSTFVGQGTSGNPTQDDDAPLNAFLRGPRGLSLATSGSVPFLLYADNQASTAVNTTCMVRALNLGTSSGTINGVSISAGRVSTIAGNYYSGCEPWNTAPANSDGGVATNSQLMYPEGILHVNGTLIVASSYDHCIEKVNSSGQISRLIGTCGTSGTADGNGTAATLRYPTGLMLDPSYASDGNFFFVDQLDQATGKLRYANFRTSQVTIAGVPVGAGTATVPAVKTILNIAPAGASQSRLNAVALFDNQICYSSGDSGNANTGAHYIVCRDRSSAMASITLMVGSNDANSSIRGGAPLNREQENINGINAQLGAPYGLDFDADGNLYVVEKYTHQVRMIRRWFN